VGRVDAYGAVVTVTGVVDWLILAVDGTPLGLFLPERRAAEARVRRSNAEARAAGCWVCGSHDGLRAVYTPKLGAVPAESWTCAEHDGVSSLAFRADGQPVPLWTHAEPCPTGPPYLSCPHRTHDTTNPEGHPR